MKFVQKKCRKFNIGGVGGGYTHCEYVWQNLGNVEDGGKINKGQEDNCFPY